MECLPGELLLQLQPLGDVPGVEDNATDLPLGAKVADMGLELPPGAEAVRDAKDELARFAGARCRAHHIPVVLVDDVEQAFGQQPLFRTRGHAAHGPADVPATAEPEDDDEIGRRADEATEVRRLPVGGADERPAEQQRQQEAADPEDDLQVDQAADIAVVGVRDRPGGVQRHVRRKRRKDSQP